METGPARSGEEVGLAHLNNSEAQLFNKSMEAYLIPYPTLSKPVNEREGCSSQQSVQNDYIGLFTTLKIFDKDFARDTIVKF